MERKSTTTNEGKAGRGFKTHEDLDNTLPLPSGNNFATQAMPELPPHEKLDTQPSKPTGVRKRII